MFLSLLYIFREKLLLRLLDRNGDGVLTVLSDMPDIALDELEANTGRTSDKLYIVGGGAKNTFLNKLTEEATGKQVIALPIEATALGNLMIQMSSSNV